MQAHKSYRLFRLFTLVSILNLLATGHAASQGGDIRLHYLPIVFYLNNTIPPDVKGLAEAEMAELK